MLWHKLSDLPVVSIAKLRGRARGAGSELLGLDLGDRIGAL